MTHRKFLKLHSVEAPASRYVALSRAQELDVQRILPHFVMKSNEDSQHRNIYIRSAIPKNHLSIHSIAPR